MPWRFHNFREHAAHVLRVNEKDGRAVSADARGTEDACALPLEPCTRLLNVIRLEADMMLPASRVLLEELQNGGILAQRLDQLDLLIGRVDETDAHSLRGKAEGRSMRLGAEHIAVCFEALLDRRGCDPDMV